MSKFIPAAAIPTRARWIYLRGRKLLHYFPLNLLIRSAATQNSFGQFIAVLIPSHFLA